MALLEVRDLTLSLPTQRGWAQALRGINFQLERGGALGLIGESGCGKSMTAMTLMGLQPERAQLGGSIRLDGQELLGQSEAAWCGLRGSRLAMIFQEPMTALNPVHAIGRQVAEPMLRHRGLDRRSALKAATGLLERVGIANASARMSDYPHQFSGGQRQRITIAMALAGEPDVLIADEPTTALDVTVQQQILDLINEVVMERDMALILISHDLGVISQNVDDMLVMYGGQVVESGPTASLFEHLGHPYSRGLLAARPQLHAPRQADGRPLPLYTIAGTVPELVDLPVGCPFAGRCGFTQDECSQTVAPLVELPTASAEALRYSSLGRHLVRCHRPEAIAANRLEVPA